MYFSFQGNLDSAMGLLDNSNAPYVSELLKYLDEFRFGPKKVAFIANVPLHEALENSYDPTYPCWIVKENASSVLVSVGQLTGRDRNDEVVRDMIGSFVDCANPPVYRIDKNDEQSLRRLGLPIADQFVAKMRRGDISFLHLVGAEVDDMKVGKRFSGFTSVDGYPLVSYSAHQVPGGTLIDTRVTQERNLLSMGLTYLLRKGLRREIPSWYTG